MIYGGFGPESGMFDKAAASHRDSNFTGNYLDTRRVFF